MSHSLLLAHGGRSLSVGSLDSYISWINRIPLLTPEEENELATRFQAHADLEAARKLVLSHLRFVVRIARGYGGYGLSQADLIQEGNIGLMNAVKRFDPTVGVRLVSFAVHWVRAEIHEFVLRNWRIVKVATTKAQRKLFFNLRKQTKERMWFSAAETKNIAEELQVTPEQVRTMEKRLHGRDESLDLVASEERGEGGEWQFPAYALEDQRYGPELQLEQADWASNQQRSLRDAMATLDSRSQNILQERWLNEKKLTLRELAGKYDISVERIRQIEKSAMEKIRSLLPQDQ